MHLPLAREFLKIKVTRIYESEVERDAAERFLFETFDVSLAGEVSVMEASLLGLLQSELR